MMIRLRIENTDRLPNGGPINFETSDGSFEIGREGRDWTLPDPDKIISGRHCEIRHQGGAYWLYDVSRNGTYVNGSAQRLAEPHRLAHGDRLRIGRYIVSVALEGGARHPGMRASEHPAGVGEMTGARGSPSDILARTDAGRASVERHGNSSPTQRASAGATSTLGPPADEILRYIADGAGIPPEILLQRDRREVAAEIGAVLRIAVEELAQLLKARAAAKVLAKSGHRTMIGSVDNNPLKFVPTTEEMLDIMFARRRAGYLDARKSVEDAFRDLKSHELATYAAMQSALAQLLEDFSPATIEKKVTSSAFASKKSRAWDAFTAAWNAREEAHENGMLDIFLSYFSEAYAKASKQK